MVDSAQDTYKVKFINFTVNPGYAGYLIKVIGPGGITFHLRDRYSSMRGFVSALKKTLPTRSF
jgi:hypothetical protein